MRLLLVEDNAALVLALVTGLGDEGYQVESEQSGSAAIERVARAGAKPGDLDAVILDLGLPDVDGLDVIRAVRGRGSFIPILVLTARDAVETRIAALDLGADDFLVKPFAFEELLARLRALMRRAAGPRWQAHAAGGVVLADDLTATIGAATIVLTPSQHALLAYLLVRRGVVVPRAELLRDVFGYAFDPGSNLLDVHLTHLRRKLADGPVRIETIRGVGVRLEIVE